MDVSFFLKERTRFIRQYYDLAAEPFLERIRKIEAEEPPFDPPYSEDGEPPFLSEWIEATTSLEILSYSCISMLASALHLYFETWRRQFRWPVGRGSSFKKGWMNGYREIFRANLGIDFTTGPSNLALLEEIVLARNQFQHPSNITNLTVDHPAAGREQLDRSFFIKDREREMLDQFDQTERSWLLGPTLHIDRERLLSAIDEVERFADWLEDKITVRYFRPQ